MLPTTQAVIQQLEDERKRKERLEWYLGQVLLEKQHLGLPSPASPPLDNLFLSPASPELEVVPGTTAIAAAIPPRTAQPVRRASSSPALSKVDEDDQDQPGRTKGKSSARRRTPPMRSISKGNDTQHTAKQLKRLLRNKEKKQNSSGLTPWARKDTPTPTTSTTTTTNNKLNPWQQQRTKALRPIVEEAAPYMVKSYISLVDATPQRPSTVYHQEPIPTFQVSPPRVEEEEELELGYVMLNQQQLQTGTADSWTRLWQQQQQLAAGGSEKEQLQQQQIQGHGFEADVQLQLDLERFSLLEEESSSGLSSEEEDKVLASLWEESGTWSKDWTLWTDDVEHLYAPPTMDSSFFSSLSSFGSQTIS